MTTGHEVIDEIAAHGKGTKCLHESRLREWKARARPGHSANVRLGRGSYRFTLPPAASKTLPSSAGIGSLRALLVTGDPQSISARELSTFVIVRFTRSTRCSIGKGVPLSLHHA